MNMNKIIERNGDWMQCYSGGRMWPLDPRADEIHIKDIAHALSLVTRFGGHSKVFYSVAEHAVRVSEICPAHKHDILKKWGLLHDAAEAYIGDMVRPLKRFIRQFQNIEDRILDKVAERFNLPYVIPKEVKAADEILLATEARDLMNGDPLRTWTLYAKPLEERIVPWPSHVAKEQFLRAFHTLFGVGA